YFPERAFGTATESFGRFVLGELKPLGLGLFLTTLPLCAMFALARRLRLWWVVLGAVIGVALIGSAALDPYRSRVYFEQRPLPPGELREAITALMAEAEIDFRDVVVERTTVSTVRVQAYFAGE